MIRINVSGDVKFPDMDFTKDLQYIAEKIIIPEIAGHIQNGTDIQGNKYPSLAESTIKAKGHPNPLIGKDRRLFSETMYQQTRKAKNEVLIRIKAVRADIGRYLQIEGIRSKKIPPKRFFNFFGVNQIMEKKAVNYMKRIINERVNNARR